LIDQPVTRERWLGVAGRASTLNGAPIAARPCAALGDAYLYATTPHMFERGAVEDAWVRVRDDAKIPLYGCDCYAYGLLAAGFADAVVEADLGPYDYLALAPIVAGAGGVMSDWAGGALRAGWTEAGGHTTAGMPREVVAAGDGRVHAQILERLAWGREMK
jgi:inositol-phosphate phosphatase/L-galactose 1-phosphate phosphatase/histidinol-phosphatase